MTMNFCNTLFISSIFLLTFAEAMETEDFDERYSKLQEIERKLIAARRAQQKQLKSLSKEYTLEPCKCLKGVPGLPGLTGYDGIPGIQGPTGMKGSKGNTFVLRHPD